MTSKKRDANYEENFKHFFQEPYFANDSVS